VRELAEIELIELRRERKEEYESRGNSCLVLGPTNRLRVKVHYVVTSWPFRYGILVLILFSALLAATESNEPKGDGAGHATDDDGWRGTVDKVILVIFAVEILLRVIDQGLFRDKGSLLRSVWGILDFVSVFIGIVDAIVASATQVQPLPLFAADSLPHGECVLRCRLLMEGCFKL
jgi:hypothetical protein